MGGDESQCLDNWQPYWTDLVSPSGEQRLLVISKRRGGSVTRKVFNRQDSRIPALHSSSTRTLQRGGRLFPKPKYEV